MTDTIRNIHTDNTTPVAQLVREALASEGIDVEGDEPQEWRQVLREVEIDPPEMDETLDMLIAMKREGMLSQDRAYRLIHRYYREWVLS